MCARGRSGAAADSAQDGDDAAISQLPSLVVGVSSADVTYYDDKSRLPSYGKWTTYYDITQGKPGGLRADESFLVTPEGGASSSRKGKRGIVF